MENSPWWQVYCQIGPWGFDQRCVNFRSMPPLSLKNPWLTFVAQVHAGHMSFDMESTWDILRLIMSVPGWHKNRNLVDASLASRCGGTTWSSWFSGCSCSSVSRVCTVSQYHFGLSVPAHIVRKRLDQAINNEFVIYYLKVINEVINLIGSKEFKGKAIIYLIRFLMFSIRCFFVSGISVSYGFEGFERRRNFVWGKQMELPWKRHGFIRCVRLPSEHGTNHCSIYTKLVAIGKFYSLCLPYETG